MLRKIISSIIILLPIAAFLMSQERLPTIGVMEFQGGSGVSAIDAKTVTEVFRSELVSAGAYTVLERGRMEEILKEQQLQQTGCTSTECAVQIGKLLNMRKMLYGTVSKLGTRYYFVVTVVDIETSKLEKSVNDSLEGFDDLSKVIKRLIEQITGGKRLVKVGESPFLKVHGMMKNNMFGSVESIQKEMPYITDAEKVQLANQFRREFFGPMLLNGLLGFGIGSFSQGDWIGGLTGLVLDGGGLTLFFIGTGRSFDYRLSSADRNIAGTMIGIGGITWLSSRLIMFVWPIVSTILYNDAVERALGLKVTMTIDAGERYCSMSRESYAFALVTVQF